VLLDWMKLLNSRDREMVDPNPWKYVCQAHPVLAYINAMGKKSIVTDDRRSNCLAFPWLYLVRFKMLVKMSIDVHSIPGYLLHAYILGDSI
jgi:hypothetical protein